MRSENVHTKCFSQRHCPVWTVDSVHYQWSIKSMASHLWKNETHYCGTKQCQTLAHFTHQAFICSTTAHFLTVNTDRLAICVVSLCVCVCARIETSKSNFNYKYEPSLIWRQTRKKSRKTNTDTQTSQNCSKANKCNQLKSRKGTEIDCQTHRIVGERNKDAIMCVQWKRAISPIKGATVWHCQTSNKLRFLIKNWEICCLVRFSNAKSECSKT